MGVDAITVGSQVAIALQSIVSRKLNPADNGIISITEFITDGKKNVLPGKVKMTGDARALSKQTNELIEKNMKKITKGICDAHGVSCDISYKTTCPVTFNESEQADYATKAANSLLGNKKSNGDIEPRLFSEDFSIMSNDKPGCFVLMGNGIEGSNGRPLHAADYDFNDELLVIGSSYWVELAEQQLK